jgi:hypothetical protein
VPHIALEGREGVTVPRGTVRLTAHAAGGSTPVLQAWQHGTQVVDDRDHPAILVLRDVTVETVVRVRPPWEVTTFGEGTRVRLTVRVDTPVERYEITVQPVDVSALPVRDLVCVEPDGDGLRVTALDAVRDLPVRPLAARARGEARRLLGYDRVRDDRAVRMAIGVDVSASMAHCLHDQGVAAAVDVLVGLWQVVGDVHELPHLCLLGEKETWLPPVKPLELAGFVADQMQRHGFELGSPSQLSEPPGTAHNRGCARFVITDAVPADFDRTGRGPIHLVVVGDGAAPDEVTGGGVAVLPAPAPGQDVVDRVLGDPARLSATVGTLLRQCGITADLADRPERSR